MARSKLLIHSLFTGKGMIFAFAFLVYRRILTPVTSIHKKEFTIDTYTYHWDVTRNPLAPNAKIK